MTAAITALGMEIGEKCGYNISEETRYKALVSLLIFDLVVCITLLAVGILHQEEFITVTHSNVLVDLSECLMTFNVLAFTIYQLIWRCREKPNPRIPQNSQVS